MARKRAARTQRGRRGSRKRRKLSGGMRAKTIRRYRIRYKNRRALRRAFIREIGVDNKTEQCKKINYTQECVTLYTRKLYWFDATYIQPSKATITAPAGGGPVEIKYNFQSGRVADRIRLIGMRMQLYWRSGIVQPLWMNMAVICPRNTLVGGRWVTNVTPTPQESCDAFFAGSNNAASIDFSTALSPFFFHYQGINNNAFKILFHKRWILHGRSLPANNSYNTASLDNWVNNAYPNSQTRKVWIPINRTISYDDSPEDSFRTEDTPVYWCFWCDTPEGGPGSPAIECGKIGYKTDIFWKEIKGV